MSRLAWMPRWVRVLLTGGCFGLFFGLTFLFGVVLAGFRLFRPSREVDRAALTRRLNVGLGKFTSLLRDIGLIAYWPPRLPPGYEGRPYLMIANHPTLLDVLLLLHSNPEMVCVVKASWHRSRIMGRLLRLTEYLPGPGHEGDRESADTAPVVTRIERKLREGVPVLVFPEGTRSKATELRRFRRGAIEAAIRAEAPILPLFIGVDRPMLMKGQPFWQVPKEGARYFFEWLEPIETEGRELDARAVTRELGASYRSRFEELLRERRELEGSAASRLGAGERRELASGESTRGEGPRETPVPEIVGPKGPRGATMRVRLIYPYFERFLEAYPELAELPPIEGLWRFRMPPALGLQILANLIPDDIEWGLTDANVEAVDYDEDVDLVAISFFTPQAESAYKIADRFRARGRKVVMGGMHPTMAPDDAAQHCDAVCIGEAERLWPVILEHARRGELRARYGPESPPPSEWVRPRRGLFHQGNGYDWKPELVQVARGCPRACPYCNIPVYQGDALRLRPVDDVVEEVAGLKGHEVYLTEDVIMFKGRSVARYATELFERLGDHDLKLFLTSSLVFNAKPRFLDTLAAAGMKSLYITFGFDPVSRGIYDGDPTMIEYGRQFVERVQERGIRFHAAFGVGFDEDGPHVFDNILSFCRKAGVLTSEFFIATPFPSTPMWQQVRQEGRLHHTRWGEFNGAHVVFDPKHMTAQQLTDGFLRLWKDFYSGVDALESLSCFVHAKDAAS